MNYIEINFEKVEGYKKLSEPAKEVLQRVYKRHNAQQGKDYKKDWIPKRIKEFSTHLIVHFINGEYLHYLPNGTWY